MKRMKIQNADKMVRGRPGARAGLGVKGPMSPSASRVCIPSLPVKVGAAMQGLREGPASEDPPIGCRQPHCHPVPSRRLPLCTCLCRSHLCDVWAYTMYVHATSCNINAHMCATCMYTYDVCPCT